MVITISIIFIPGKNQKAVVCKCPLHIRIEILLQPRIATSNCRLRFAVVHVVELVRHHKRNRRQIDIVRLKLRCERQVVAGRYAVTLPIDRGIVFPGVGAGQATRVTDCRNGLRINTKCLPLGLESRSQVFGRYAEEASVVQDVLGASREQSEVVWLARMRDRVGIRK